MSCPVRYLESCVPRALAVLLERPVQEVAGYLWQRGAASELDARGVGGGHQFGTRPVIAGDVAIRLGFRVQMWNPTGALFLSAPEFARYCRGVAHREAVTVERPRPVTTAPPMDGPEYVLHLDGDPEPEDAPRLLTVRGWRDRYPCGRWLLVVHDVESSMHHALALIDGEVEAGGEQYRDAVVVQAFRMLPPKTFQLEGVAA